MWHLAAFEYGSGLRFGMTFPIHYEESSPSTWPSTRCSGPTPRSTRRAARRADEANRLRGPPWTSHGTASPAAPLVNRGALRHAEGDLDGAEADYRAAIELDPSNATAHSNLGFLLAVLGRHDEAIG